MIPKYDDIMLPLLRVISNGEVWILKDVVSKLADLFKEHPEFKMSDDELKQTFQDGTPIFRNRVGWARAHLKAAKLIDSPERGKMIITERGKEVLSSNLSKIDRKFLMQFPEFREVIQYMKNNNKMSDEDVEKEFNELSPDEKLELIHNEVESSLVSNILSIIENVNFKIFEKIISDLLVKMGYGESLRNAIRLVGGVGDEVIDAIIKQDPLGLDNIYIQAKRWKGTVGRPEIKKFVRALHREGATKGVFITSGEFSDDAKRYVSGLSNIRIMLIDGRELALLMVRYNIGVTTYKIFELKKIDSDYFDSY